MKTGYNYILQSAESDEKILDREWKNINWNSIENDIFKIQKRIFEAEKEVLISFYRICSSRMS